MFWPFLTVNKMTGGKPTMEWHPIQGRVILLGIVSSRPSSHRNCSHQPVLGKWATCWWIIPSNRQWSRQRAPGPRGWMKMAPVLHRAQHKQIIRARVLRSFTFLFSPGNKGGTWSKSRVDRTLDTAMGRNYQRRWDELFLIPFFLDFTNSWKRLVKTKR